MNDFKEDSFDTERKYFHARVEGGRYRDHNVWGRRGKMGHELWFSLSCLQDTGHPSECAFNAQGQGRNGEMSVRKSLKQDPFPTPLRC